MFNIEICISLFIQTSIIIFIVLIIMFWLVCFPTILRCQLQRVLDLKEIFDFKYNCVTQNWIEYAEMKVGK